ncbi:putative membrane protein [Propionispora sp. 2/2-37]|uniref:acyltransferase n=1 Tax=Propionispora sp. 2/2-37 TaxID=1677858 RepID=UPI0006BB7B02|nr:acyltransferase [Propionispora sp. 2/2-37]CUH96901.1 putative membrane protein [Propionispora sp. 2/2-37]
MKKQYIPALEYIRGLAMLGVIGIHTGAYSLSNQHVNIHLFALLEILTRFSVPIFFFVSAFGLFLQQKDLSAPLHYIAFMKRRIQAVFIPYVIWSLLYLLHSSIISHNFAVWSLPLLGKYLFFGLASYQLYFLVLLLWFYALMPLWRIMLRHMLQRPVASILSLLLLQIIFNYYSSYLLHPDLSNAYLNSFIDYRMNYWIAHYLFIFLLGALCALHFDLFKQVLKHYSGYISLSFLITTFGILFYYYYLLFYKGYSPQEAVFTDHQLSPIGILYTFSSALFWFMVFSSGKLPACITSTLKILGKHSYFIYLVHPFVMYVLSYLLSHRGLLMTAANTIVFYLLTLGISLTVSLVTVKVSTKLPKFGLFLTGSTPKTTKSVSA